MKLASSARGICVSGYQNRSGSYGLQSRLRLLNFLQRAPVCRLPLHAPVGAAGQHHGGGAGGAKAVALRELVRVMPSA